jgi:fluoride exporter
MMTPVVDDFFRDRIFFVHLYGRGEMFRNMLVFAGGGIGAVFRYLLSGWVYKVVGTDFPYGTLAVNVIGCFVIGLFLTMGEDRFLISPSFRIFFAVGILGGFTTFSTFNFETLQLLREGAVAYGVLNVAASIIVGLAATWVGTLAGRLI